MPSKVQLITGPARCGKTQQLLNRYRHRLSRLAAANVMSSRGKYCWLAPNQTALSQIQDSLLETAEKAILQPSLLTFASFAERLITRSPRRIRPISQLQKRRLLQQVIRSALEQGQLEHFSQVASTPGFVIQVDEFVAELKRADIWPEDFERWCQLPTHGGPRNNQRSIELSQIYAAYQQQLHRGELYDAEGRFWAAREILADSVASSSSFDLVIINGFNDFTTAQYDILRLLGERSSELLIALTLDTFGSESASDEGNSLLFAKTGRTLTRLREIFPQLEIESLAVGPTEDYSLRQLQHQLFRDTETSKAEGGRGKAERGEEREVDGVEIVAANSELGEVEAIAERIKKLLFQGVPPQEIAVASRGGESLATRIRAVFPDFGIPFASEMRPRLDSAPLIRALLTLLRLHLEDWPFRTLLEVVNHRLFTRFDADDGGTSRFLLQPRNVLEICLRSAQLPTGKTELLEQLEFRQQAGAQDGGTETDQRRSQVSLALDELRQVDQLLSALPTQASINEWVLALEKLLQQFGALPQTGAKKSREWVAWDLLRRNLLAIAQVDTWNSTEQTLLTLPELRELIFSIAREQRMPAPHDSVGRVRILSVESARKLTIKHLFLAGLSEQSFSGAAPAEQASAAEDSQSMAANLPETLQEQAAPGVRRSDAMLLFYELVTRATESLTLSYPALDAKGQPLSPSPLLTELERSASPARLPRTTLALGQVVAPHGTPHSLGSFRRQAVDQALVGKQQWLAGMISQPTFVRTGSSILNGIEGVVQRGVRDSFGAYEGLLLSETAQAALAQRFDSDHLWSPSRLESYAACPFRFFGETLLGLEPINELRLSNDARRRGSLLHQVLATIHQQLSETESETVESHDLVQRFLTTLDAAVKASPLRGIEQSLREIERREIEAWAPNYAEQESSYRSQWNHLDEPPRPAYFEVRFGPETRNSSAETADPASTPLPFELDLGDEQICLTGQIDRVDIGQIGGVKVFNIIDYKSGKEVKLILDKVRAGHQLQLPLYALAAEQLLLADQGAVALATGYWNIQGKGFVSQHGGSLQMRELADQTLQTSAEWQQLQPEILSKVQHLIGGIRAGQFPVYNEDEHCTRSCSLSTVCRVAQIRSLEKTWPVEIEKT